MKQRSFIAGFNSKRWALISFLFLICLVTATISLAAVPPVKLYPAPKGEVLNKVYTVSVNGRNLPVYDARIGAADNVARFKAVDDLMNSEKYFDTAAFGYFDMSSNATVAVSVNAPIKTVKILPTSAGIRYTVVGRKVTFKVNKPQNLTIEINGEFVRSLHLFVNSFEAALPNRRDTNVIYFGPGIHYVSNLMIGNNKTVYVAGGAIIKLFIGKNEKFGVEPSGLKNYVPRLFVNGNHVKIRGRGIIDAALCPVHSANVVMLRGNDISMEGVIMRNSCGWTVPIRESSNVTIDNIKILGYRANSDGIDICNSRQVTVKNCFIRSNDDLIVIKTFRGEGEAKQILIKNCVLWNQLAHPLSVGAELREPVSDVLFTDCDIIHDQGREWSMRVFQSDGTLARNITFNNIRIEESHRLISCWIGKNANSEDKGLGQIRDITFSNIKATGNPLSIEMISPGAQNVISGIRLKNVLMNSKPLKLESIERTGAVKNITIEP